MKLLVRLLLIAALVALAAFPSRARADSYERERLATFVVQTVLPNGEAAIGAGVAVGRSGDIITIATAAHALVGPVSALRILDTTRRGYYTVVAERVLLEYDVAFIDVRAQPNADVVPLDIAPPVAGEDVVVVGHHGGSFWTISSARVVSTNLHLPSEFGSARITIACDACAHGDSGAGVFDSDGRLIGILTKAWRDPDGRVRFIEVEPAALLAQEVEAQRLTAAAPPVQP